MNLKMLSLQTLIRQGLPMTYACARQQAPEQALSHPADHSNTS
jgi:hypothetical protein